MRLVVIGGVILTLIACVDDDPVPSASLASTMDAADSLHAHGEFDSARVLWTRALSEARREGINAAQGRSLTGLGLASYRLGKYDDAQKELGAALTIQRDEKLIAQMPKTYNALGLVSYQQGRLVAAAAYYDSSSRAATVAKDGAGVAKAAGNLALVQVELGEYDNARAGFETMRIAGQQLGDARLQGNALNNTGMLDIRLGNPTLALAELTKARRLYRSIDYKTGEQNNLGQLATAYAAIGDYGRAFILLDSALTMCRELGLRQEEASNLEVLATLHHRAGDPQRALRFFTHAQAINKELDLTVEQGANAKDRAIIERDNGRLDAAAELTLEALSAHRAAEARFEELNDILLLAEIEQRRGSRVKATAWLASADSVAGKIGAPMAETRVDLGRARVSAIAGDWNETIRALSSGPTQWRLAGYTGVAEGHTLRARAHAHLGAIDQAIAEGHKAVAAANALRSSAGSLEMRTRIGATHAEAYSDLINALVTKGAIATAFEVSDAAKGITLLEYIESGDKALNAKQSNTVTVRESLLRRAGQLEMRRTELLEGELNHNDSAVLAQIDRRLTEVRTEYEELMSRAPGTAPAVIGQSNVRVGDIQSSLSPDEILIEYHLTPDRLHIFALSRGGLKHFEHRESIASISQRVRLANDGVQSGRGDSRAQSWAVLSALYGSAIAPIDSIASRGGTLIIVAHGIMRKIPFAALRSTRGEWLIESHPVLYMASGASLRALRSIRTTSRSADQASVFVPLPDRLPGTVREAAAVTRSLPTGRTFFAKAATESALRNALRARGIVHVATHGELNERNPAFSRVDLYPTSNGGADDDGRLEAHELLDQQLAADLVFLSGCETAAGASINPYQGGEEYSALAQLLLNSRIRNVIATMWKIDDDAAALFAERFYRHLERAAPAAALSAAQRDLSHSARYSHPAFWAGYQLSGDGRPFASHTSVSLSVQ
jgi:CHAT domain-containing protein